MELYETEFPTRISRTDADGSKLGLFEALKLETLKISIAILTKAMLTLILFMLTLIC